MQITLKQNTVFVTLLDSGSLLLKVGVEIDFKQMSPITFCDK